MLHRFFLSMCLAIGCASLNYGAVVVSESFDYETGYLAGNGAGSFGFSDNWSGHTSFDVAGSSLTAPVSFPQSIGNRVTADAFGGNRNVVRTLSQTIGADNSTSFMSFLMQAEDVVGAGAFNGWFSFTLRSADRNITLGKESFSNKYKVESSLGDISRSNVDIVANETHLFVMRADFLPGADEFRLYIDPPAGQSEPLSADATLSSFDLGTVTTIGLDGPGAFGFDEFRMGTTWHDVTPTLPGDYNLNGAVDAADYTVWRNTVGSASDFRADGTGPSGTPNQIIDQLDYDFWKQRYSEAAGRGAALGLDTIPEPTSAALALMAAILVAKQSIRLRSSTRKFPRPN